MRHYTLDLFSAEHQMLWGYGGPHKDRRAAIRHAVKRYSEAHPEGPKAAYARVRLDADARTERKYLLALKGEVE